MRPLFLSDARRRTAAALAAIMMAAVPVVAAPVVPETVTWQEAIEYAAPDGTPLLLNKAAPRDGAGPLPRFEGTGGNPEQPSDVACVVNIYGANDFTKSYGRSKDAHEVLPLWFGGDLSTHRARHIEGSPLFWVTPAAAPTRCIHGTEDDHVALEQSQWIVERLVAAAVPADLVVLEGAGHGFKGADATRAEQAIFTFFDTHLKPTASP
jgi:pimeloyl-ACP methyl ester carboxylesterase